MNIRYLDLLRDEVWERFFIRQCGLDYSAIWDGNLQCYHHSKNKEILTQEILETYLDGIIDKIIGFQEYVSNPNLRPRNPKYDGFWVITNDDIQIGYQILGVLILQTGSFLPKIVEDSILFSTRWEYDQGRQWSKAAIDERKKNLSRFRNAIKNHKSGKVVKINF